MAPIPISPSRASEFKACPLLYKFRVVDQLPEPADASSLRGTLVHLVLEKLFRQPVAERSLDLALGLIEPSWEELVSSDEAEGLVLPDSEVPAWLEEARNLVRNYFLLEDPTAVETHELEWWVELTTERTFLRGIIDRVDVMDDGSWVLSDYKTGNSPSDRYVMGSFFGLKFYALVCWKTYGRMPRELRLFHLRKPEVIRLTPTERMLQGVQSQVEAIGMAIGRAMKLGDFRAKPGPLCNWCPHQQLCPAFEQRQAV